MLGITDILLCAVRLPNRNHLSQPFARNTNFRKDLFGNQDSGLEPVFGLQHIQYSPNTGSRPRACLSLDDVDPNGSHLGMHSNSNGRGKLVCLVCIALLQQTLFACNICDIQHSIIYPCILKVHY